MSEHRLDEKPYGTCSEQLGPLKTIEVIKITQNHPDSGIFVDRQERTHSFFVEVRRTLRGLLFQIDTALRVDKLKDHIRVPRFD